MFLHAVVRYCAKCAVLWRVWLRGGNAVHPSGKDASSKRRLKRDSPDMAYMTMPFVVWSILVRGTLHAQGACDRG